MKRRLIWHCDNEDYFVKLPATQEEMQTFRQDLTAQIEKVGSHLQIRAFSRGGLWCEIISFTVRKSPTGETIVRRGYFVYFIYDCRKSKYEADPTKLISCEVKRTTIPKVFVSAEKAIDLLLEEMKSES
jgi:hypothetical protein